MLVPEYRHKKKLDVVWCGPYKVFEVLKKGENVRLDNPAPFNGLSVFNRDTIKPCIHQEEQPLWEFPMPPVKTGASPGLVKILARRRVGSRKPCIASNRPSPPEHHGRTSSILTRRMAMATTMVTLQKPL